MEIIRKLSLILVTLVLITLPIGAQAVMIGSFDFDTDGYIDGMTGGVGFDWDNVTISHTGTSSDWDNLFGSSVVVDGKLITNNSGAKREFNGPTSGEYNSDERLGAFRGVGAVYYSVSLTRNDYTTWSGISAYDFDRERIFFGVPGSQNYLGTNQTWGIHVHESNDQIVNYGVTYSDVAATWGQTFNMVAKLDFDNDLLSLWINPFGEEGANTAVATRSYNGTNWNTAVRLASEGITEWDNLRIGTSWEDVVAGSEPVPEPATIFLLGSGLAGIAAVSRKKFFKK